MTDKFQLSLRKNQSAKSKNQPPKNCSQKFCKNHPDIKLNWQCIECGSEFCDRCVRQIREHYHLDIGRSAVCPQCRGMCRDFREEAAKIRQAEEEERTNKRNSLISNAVCLILSVPFLLEAAQWSIPFWTTEFKFLLMVTAILTIGPLKKIDLVYKCGALLYFMWLAHPALIAALLLANASNELGYIIFKTPVKYLAEAILITVSFFLVEKVSDAFSAIYYSRGPVPTGRFGVRGWSLFILSFIVIIVASLTGSMGGSLIVEDDLTQVKKLSIQFADEMAKDYVDSVKIGRLESELSIKSNPFKENREIDPKKVETLNTLLEPYRGLSMDEAWSYFEKGKAKMHENKANIDQIKTNIFNKDFGKYKTVGEIIDGNSEFDIFAKHYLYMHLIYGGGE